MEMNMPMVPMGFGGASEKSGFGSDWIAFLIIALIFGWGGNGTGGFGRGNGAAGTDNLISNEFNFSSLDNGIRGLERGICDLGYANAQQGSQTRETINAVGSNLTTTLMGLGSQMVSQADITRSAITSAAFENERGLAGLSAQLANCCCETNRNLDSIRYENAKNTCEIVTNANMNTRDLIVAGNANTQRIVDLMTQNTIQDLRDKNNALTLQVSQQAQSANIIDNLKPFPQPSYIVSNPYCGA